MLFEKISQLISLIKERIEKGKDDKATQIDDILRLEYLKVKNGAFKEEMRAFFTKNLEIAKKSSMPEKNLTLVENVIGVDLGGTYLKFEYFALNHPGKVYELKQTERVLIKQNNKILIEDYIEDEIQKFVEKNKIILPDIFLSFSYDFKMMEEKNTMKMLSFSKNFAFQQTEVTRFKTDFKCILNDCAAALVAGYVKNHLNIAVICGTGFNLVYLDAKDNIVCTEIGTKDVNDFILDELFGGINICKATIGEDHDIDHTIAQNRIELKKRLLVEFLKMAVEEVSKKENNKQKVNLILNGSMFDYNESVAEELQKIKNLKVTIQKNATTRYFTTLMKSMGGKNLVKDIFG